jgi:hypothetical protein
VAKLKRCFFRVFKFFPRLRLCRSVLRAVELSEWLLSIPAVQWYLMTGGNWPY